ncbi:hypothetical protein SNOG_08283 [Parastagonospora nodorum SN15]|uniref:Uncharacterized protein n=1 Tax=Phaeosphaeria nodorum (strain SN15 / ATCC MYA-4574 / FGSC 10173) TaxID=321614 RepID=Q0UIY1_PHANO|nr:hypothetical protein SNOG_08283 [Parastagonospora nodorum SN15]EAT84559.1 hypothetical protein SNOG_08283 [Parastagonospora nodorum SN15]
MLRLKRTLVKRGCVGKEPCRSRKLGQVQLARSTTSGETESRHGRQRAGQRVRRAYRIDEIHEPATSSKLGP